TGAHQGAHARARGGPPRARFHVPYGTRASRRKPHPGAERNYSAPCATGAPSSARPRAVRRFGDRNEYSAGTRYSDRNVEPRRPPTTAMPSDWRLAEAAPSDSAMGSTPRMVAALVIRIGRK